MLRTIKHSMPYKKMFLHSKRRTSIAKYIFVFVCLVFILGFNLSYVIFLISRAWYDWITSSLNSEVVVVNVVDLSAFEREENNLFQKATDILPKGYLG